jgi:NAD(P)-dependent dehydrogenase (short-subunit alcohol dehydrogenase family)
MIHSGMTGPSLLVLPGAGYTFSIEAKSDSSNRPSAERKKPGIHFQAWQGNDGSGTDMPPDPRPEAGNDRRTPTDLRTREMTVLDRFRLDGRVAIVTGASSGLGVGFARALAEAGADVILGARRADLLDEVVEAVEKSGRRAVAVRTDITDPAECAALVATALDRFGRLDVLVNNAGLSHPPGIAPGLDAVRRILEVNLLGSYSMTTAAVAAMDRGGAVVNISSAVAMRPSGLPTEGYTASKAALIALTRDLAKQFAPRSIRVNCLAPGFFPSEMTESRVGGLLRSVLEEGSVMKRVGEQDELSAALLFLASDASSYITGLTIPVDGGYVLP